MSGAARTDDLDVLGGQVGELGGVLVIDGAEPAGCDGKRSLGHEFSVDRRGIRKRMASARMLTLLAGVP